MTAPDQLQIPAHLSLIHASLAYENHGTVRKVSTENHYNLCKKVFGLLVLLCYGAINFTNNSVYRHLSAYWLLLVHIIPVEFKS